MVYVVESGYYEDRGINRVCSSPQKAREVTIASHGPQYRIDWGELVGPDNRGEWSFTAHYHSVRGYSTEHDREFTVTPYELDAR